ncbi:tRNA pseudouridine(55) synthase TruB [bacterium]|nr:MAG: tRNA pseudouridine(55) synthase TruB [bacterium]
MHGVLNLLKPPGMTSHDAVAFVRRVLKEKRVGHTGTLDPAAAGVLPICVGQATRIVEYLQSGTKEYIAEATFGFETDTLDAVGTTIRKAPTAQISLEAINAVLDRFRGEIEQVPPLYSAIKVDGQRLYDVGRSGGTAEIPTRKVTISALEVTGFTPGESPTAMIKIECSGGTYIRSLVRDIGKALGSAATMTFLVRTRGGAFKLDEAVSCSEFASNPTLIPFEETLLWCARSAVVNDDGALTLFQGKILKSPKPGELGSVDEGEEQRAQVQPPKNSILIHNEAKTLFALAVPSRETGFHRAEKVFDLRGPMPSTKSTTV